MDVVGDRQYVAVPGDKTHDLPPLLVRGRPEVERLDKTMAMAQELIETEDLIPGLPPSDSTPELEHRRMDLAINLVEQYLAFVDHWQWGHGILEWIRQCEITFESTPTLRSLLRPDVWPHASRSSFVTLLEDKRVPHAKVKLDQAVGLRLTFRQPPPLACFSDQFLFYLNNPIGASAYHAWAERTAGVSSLPPERFRLQVVTM